jgi:hypothetical protein
VRVQLKHALAAVGVATSLAFAPAARAQVVDFNTTHGIFYEAPTRTHMFVYTPGASLQVSPSDFLDVRAGWEADVVSGASVSVKAGPAYQATHPAADVVSTASVHDLRNAANGGFTLRKDIVTFTGGYAYSTEHDYRSNSFNVSARTDTYDKNSQFEIDYAHNFDSVCDRAQPTATSGQPTEVSSLETSIGCFTSDPTRTTHSIAIDSYQAGWTQTWTPVLSTQLLYTGEIQNGFLSNPYRSVIIAEGREAQEHHPENRARQSVAARLHYYIRPLKAALRFGVRAYDDTWGIKSEMVEAEFEKHLGEAFRVTLRGRGYNQSGARFWSDDYTGGNPPLGPQGQYWSGDRELSPFWSWSVGLRGIYTILPRSGRLLGMMTSLKLSLGADVISYHYDDFTLGGVEIGDARAYLGTFSVTALF